MKYSEICDAIRELNKLEIYYDGGYRIVEPHCHGVTNDGNPVLRAYQVEGHSRSGDLPAWRLFRLDRATGITKLTDRFSGARPDYKKGDVAMNRIYCEL